MKSVADSFEAFAHAQVHLWGEVYRAARADLAHGIPYRVATRGRVVTVRSLEHLAAVTRCERAWLGPIWSEDQRR